MGFTTDTRSRRERFGTGTRRGFDPPRRVGLGAPVQKRINKSHWLYGRFKHWANFSARRRTLRRRWECLVQGRPVFRAHRWGQSKRQAEHAAKQRRSHCRPPPRRSSPGPATGRGKREGDRKRERERERETKEGEACGAERRQRNRRWTNIMIYLLCRPQRVHVGPGFFFLKGGACRRFVHQPLFFLRNPPLFFDPLTDMKVVVSFPDGRLSGITLKAVGIFIRRQLTR